MRTPAKFMNAPRPPASSTTEGHKVTGRRPAEDFSPGWKQVDGDRAVSVNHEEAVAPVDPCNLLRVIEVAAKTAGVEGVGVHTLRHSAAVAWLEAGVHIKAVADLLGHSSIAITGDIYGHTSDATTRAAIDGLTSTLGL